MTPVLEYLDDIHGSHGEASPVDHAPNVAIHANIVQLKLGGCHLARVLLGGVPVTKDVLLSERGIVIEIDFSINTVYCQSSVRI